MDDYPVDVQQLMDEVKQLLVEIMDQLDESQMLLDQMESIYAKDNEYKRNNY